MTEEPVDPTKSRDRVTRRLHAIFPAQAAKLAKLAKAAGVDESYYLRQLIDVAYVEKFIQKGTSTYHNGG